MIMKRFQPTNKSEKIVISIRLNLDKVEELDKIASKTDISRNQLINQCIDYALKILILKNKNSDFDNHFFIA